MPSGVLSSRQKIERPPDAREGRATKKRLPKGRCFRPETSAILTLMAATAWPKNQSYCHQWKPPFPVLCNCQSRAIMKQLCTTATGALRQDVSTADDGFHLLHSAFSHWKTTRNWTLIARKTVHATTLLDPRICELFPKEICGWWRTVQYVPDEIRHRGELFAF
jgi:hypothetical protein